MKNAGATAENPKQLVEKLKSLLEEAEKTLGNGLTQGSHPLWKQITERYAGLRDQAEEFCQKSREKIVQAAKQTDQTIRDHPYESLAVSLAVGILLGAFLRGRR